MDVSHRVPELRQKFYDKFKENIDTGQYDAFDLERVDHEDVYLECFLKHQKGNMENAVQMMDTSLKWRKDLGLNDLTDKSFPRELHDIGGVYYHNHDKDGHIILYFKISSHRKEPEKFLLVKKFVAWWIDKHFLKKPGEKMVVIMDMSGAGLSNLDIDLVKFQISCFTTFYPALLAYMMIYEMPWILNTIWKVIKNLLSAEQQKAVIFVKKAEVHQYIRRDQLWEHMGGMDTYEYTYIPPDDSGIDMANGELHTPTEETGDIPGLLVNNKNSSMNNLRKRVTFAEQEQTLYTSVEDGSSVDSSSGDSISVANEKQGSGNPPVQKNKTEETRKRSDSGSSLVSAITVVGSIDLQPREELKFLIKDPNSETPQTLTINNVADSRVAFKVKTTAPEKFRVRPSSGIIKIGAKAEVCINLQPGHEDSVTREKFLVMVMQVSESIRSASQVSDQWKLVSTDSRLYSEYRLKCSCQRVRAGTPEDSSESTTILLQKLNSILESQKRLESRLEKVHRHQMMYMVCFIFLIVAVCIAYYTQVLPVNKYTVNACMPHLF